MTTFPGAGAEVYYNEAGEPLGWDYPARDEYDPAEFEEPNPLDDEGDRLEVDDDVPVAVEALGAYLADLLHGGHLTALSGAQVELLERLLDLAAPGWDE